VAYRLRINVFLAVNPEQVRKWNLPERSIKKINRRAKAFYKAFDRGAPSVELDALHPDTLRQLVRETIGQHLDTELLDTVAREEMLARQTLHKLQAAYGTRFARGVDERYLA
jgi:hypothetical protein